MKRGKEVSMFLGALEEGHGQDKAIRAFHHMFSKENIKNTLTAEFFEGIKSKSNFETLEIRLLKKDKNFLARIFGKRPNI